MDHYIDITILPDPDFKPTMLMGVLFNKLHRGLVDSQSNRIAVSFPQYQSTGKSCHLGGVLRLHGEQQSLQTLINSNWLKGMNDHVEKTAATAIPPEHDWISVRRVQCKSNVQRLRERRMKRKNETLEQATLAIPDEVEQTLSLPFVMVKSNSTKQQFRLFISQTKVATAPTVDDATFNAYGLSAQALLPSF